MVREVLFGMLVVASTMSQAAEPAKLVLACQGHTQYLEADSQSLPVSLGIIVNLATKLDEAAVPKLRDNRRALPKRVSVASNVGAYAKSSPGANQRC